MEIRLIDFNNLQIFVLIVIIEELLRHNGISIDLILLDLFTLLNVLRFVLKQLTGKNRLSHNRLLLDWALRLGFQCDLRIMCGSCNNSCTKDLSELWMIIPTLRVDIMSLHILTINSTSNGRIGISVSVRVKSGLTKIGRDSRIRQPSAHMLHLMNLMLDVFQLFGSLCSLLLVCLISLLQFHLFLRLLFFLTLFDLQSSTVLRTVRHCTIREHLVTQRF